MSAKPTDLVRFAVDGSDVDAAHVSPPDSGLRDTGYPLDDVPTSANFNYFLNRYHRWIQYLSGGALSGNHSIAGALTVGGQPLSFSDFTYTADNTTDQLTATAHGLDTGDGPVRTSNSGGGLPGGLAAATDYYVIKLTADTFKLATSRANALSETPVVNITSNGTGTQTLLHQSGTARVTDATVTRDLTVGRKLIVGSLTIGGEIYGVNKRQVIVDSWLASGTAPTKVANPGGSPVPVWKIPTTNTATARIPYEVGETITAVKLEIYGDGAADFFATVKWDASVDGTGTLTIVNNDGRTNEPASWSIVSLLTIDVGALASGGSLWIQIDVSGGTQIYLGVVELSVRRLLPA